MKIRQTGTSAIVGKNIHDIYELEEFRERMKKLPVVIAFLDDIDIQEMTLCSTNIGFVYTFTKIREKGD